MSIPGIPGVFVPGQPLQLAEETVAAPLGTPVLTYVTAISDATNATTYTFTNANIGTAAADRLVVVAVNGVVTTGRTISSVTIGGNAATLVTTTASANAQTGLYQLSVASGTTATIVVTFSGANNRCTIHIYTITGLQSTTKVGADSTTAGSGTTLNRTIAISQGGVAIGVAFVSNSPNTCSWTNLTKDDGVTNEVSELSSASSSNMAANAGLTITATGSGTAGACALSVASWR